MYRSFSARYDTHSKLVIFDYYIVSEYLNKGSERGTVYLINMYNAYVINIADQFKLFTYVVIVKMKEYIPKKYNSCFIEKLDLPHNNKNVLN